MSYLGLSCKLEPATKNYGHPVMFLQKHPFCLTLKKSMQHIERPHGNILEGKNKRFSNNPLFGEIINHYNEWVNETIKLNSADNEDFTISKVVKCKFINNDKEESAEFVVPAIAIECKTFIPSTMLGQSDFEAQKIKQGNPFSLYIVVAEQNALSEDVLLKNSKIDEIFILRRQKRNAAKNTVSDKKPIDFVIVKELYEFVKNHLRKDWFNSKKATERGRLINL